MFNFFNDKFSKAKSHLASKEPYYSFLAKQCSIRSSDEIETISVDEIDGRIRLLYSEKWVETLTIEQCAEAIKHVLNHLIFNHIGNPMYNTEDQKMNIAMDLAINTCLDKSNLPPGFIHPTDLGLPLHKETMVYYNMLEGSHMEKCKGIADKHCSGSSENKKAEKKDTEKKDPNQQENKGGFKKPGDNHAQMKCTSGQSQVQKQAQVMLSNAYNKSQGQLPSGYGDGLKQLLKLFLAPPEIPWNQVLRRFIALSSNIRKTKTWKRPNRRFNEEYKGVKKEQTLTVFVGLDESGSISNKEWAKFMSEIEGIYKTKKCKIYIAKFTAKVEEVNEYKGTKIDSTYRYNGGTNFQPVFEEAETYNPDAFIMFTDGYNFDSPCKYNKPVSVLWVITKDGRLNEKFGSEVKLKEVSNPNISW